MARNLGIAAIVTDGMVRDLAGIDATGMPVCARGLNPNSPHKDGPGELGTEIAIGGTLVRSGDIIRGDADGVVVVSADRTDAVVYELGKVQDKEKLMDSWVNDGLKAPPWLQAALGDGAVIFLDEAKT
jgi:4-hydroxy-4-methyl-2-oxoglutarate aldolase